MKIKHTMMAMGAATMIMLPAAGALAADFSSTTAQPAVEAEAAIAANVSDEKLKEFAEVHQEVESMNAEYQAKIAATSDATEKSALSAEANKEMMALVEDSDLSITEYNQIAQLVQKDITLQNKYRQLLVD
ncbi:MAG: DUF4168 domain-containing protein [Bdellovibrionales bacterium]|jgi:uncharacterized protein YjaG (DUF416 family)|nr:DUF4168 domain-containing protein [Bdellovibrionales bacterium]